MDCAKHFHTTGHFDAAGDALLLLSDVKNISQDSLVPFLSGSPERSTLRHCALRAAFCAVDINSPLNPSFVEAVLMSIRPPIQRGHNGGDVFANAIQLLQFSVWPCNHPLVGSPLIDIQLLIFLVLPVPSLENAKEFHQYCHRLIHFMHRVTNLDLPVDYKRAAIHIAYRMRQDLAMVTGTPSLSVPVPLQTEVLSELSPALLTIVQFKFDPLDCFFYSRLIFTLASRPKWVPRLEEDGHINRCFDIILVPPQSGSELRFEPELFRTERIVRFKSERVLDASERV
ncbi:hypothetical protein BDR04DRAFT_1147363 [Suillus decipiens]|nr:hypothetical protein BDR04DRAFT_1147363 [Suillus decipiens]